jgi:hypothetical protein
MAEISSNAASNHAQDHVHEQVVCNFFYCRTAETAGYFGLTAMP